MPALLGTTCRVLTASRGRRLPGHAREPSSVAGLQKWSAELGAGGWGRRGLAGWPCGVCGGGGRVHRETGAAGCPGPEAVSARGLGNRGLWLRGGTWSAF